MKQITSTEISNLEAARPTWQAWRRIGADEAATILPTLAETLREYAEDGCHIYATDGGRILSLHTDSQTLALLDGATDSIDAAHQERGEGEAVCPSGLIILKFPRTVLAHAAAEEIFSHAVSRITAAAAAALAA